MRELKGLDKLTPAMRGPVGEYARLIDELFPSSAKALTCFGRVLTDFFDEHRDTVASVLVVDAIDLDTLKQLAHHGSRLGGLRISAPLIMTPSYIRGSLDTFPLEMLEIQQKHVTLFGEDFFLDLPIEAEHIRLECEREFKGMLIQLRQGLLKAADQEFVLAEIQHGIGESMVRTLRGLLWIKGRKEPVPRDEVIDSAAALTGRKLSGLRPALDAGYEPGWDDFKALYDDVEALSHLADEAEGGKS